MDLYSGCPPFSGISETGRNGRERQLMHMWEDSPSLYCVLPLTGPNLKCSFETPSLWYMGLLFRLVAPFALQELLLGCNGTFLTSWGNKSLRLKKEMKLEIAVILKETCDADFQLHSFILRLRKTPWLCMICSSKKAPWFSRSGCYAAPELSLWLKAN